MTHLTACSRLRRGVELVATVLVLGAVLWFWPAHLGGSTRLVMVSGTSMEPGYRLGDVVVARSQGTPKVGDVIVFEVPDGVGAGQLVIHRIVGQRDDGSFVTQGDNRAAPDEWSVRADHVVGQPIVHLPRSGVALQFLRQGWVLAVILGLLALVILWPSPSDDADTPFDDADAHPDLGVRLSLDDDPPAYLTEAMLAEAEAWVDEQLSLTGIHRS